MRKQLHQARNLMQRTARDIAHAHDISLGIEPPTHGRNLLIGLGIGVIGVSSAIISGLYRPFSHTAFLGSIAVECAGAFIMAAETAKSFAAGWRQDAPARAERHRADRLADRMQTLLHANGHTAEQQQARRQLLSAIRGSDAAAMKRASPGDADRIQQHNARKQQFIDTLICDALRDGTKRIDGTLYEHKETNGRVQRGILFTNAIHDHFRTGKPATLFLLSAKNFSYAEQAAAEHSVAFATPPEGLLQKISEATSAALAIVTSPPRPYALSAKIAADEALTKKQIPINDRAMDKAASSGGFILFHDRKDPGVQRGIIHLGDGPESKKPYMITPLTAATLRHAAQRAKTINSELTVQSGNLREILSDYKKDHTSNDSSAPARRNWRAAIAASPYSSSASR